VIQYEHKGSGTPQPTSRSLEPVTTMVRRRIWDADADLDRDTHTACMPLAVALLAFTLSPL